MAHNVHIWQLDEFSAFEGAISHLQNAENAQFFRLWEQQKEECPTRPSTHRYISTRLHITVFVGENHSKQEEQERMNLPTYLPTYLLTYLPTYLPTDLVHETMQQIQHTTVILSLYREQWDLLGKKFSKNTVLMSTHTCILSRKKADIAKNDITLRR